jgi:uncharacterized protein (TIGR00255 family)
MARSMTGFGRAAGELDGETIAVEVSAVNHRYFDASFRMPYAWAGLEPVFRELLKKHISRGKLNISIRREHGPSGRQSIGFDRDLAQQYIAHSKGLADVMHTTEALSLNTLIALEGVFFPEEEQQDLDAVSAVLQDVILAAAGQFNGSREAEGRQLCKDIAERVGEMREALAVIEACIPELAAAYETRLRERVAELNADAAVKEDRLAVEIAMMAEKSDVNEEVVRLKAHFDHVEELLASAEPVGRELNFLAQEIQRETNTLGSKLRDIGVVREIIHIKTELEKVREQAQNIE